MLSLSMFFRICERNANIFSSTSIFWTLDRIFAPLAFSSSVSLIVVFTKFISSVLSGLFWCRFLSSTSNSFKCLVLLLEIRTECSMINFLNRDLHCSHHVASFFIIDDLKSRHRSFRSAWKSELSSTEVLHFQYPGPFCLLPVFSSVNSMSEWSEFPTGTILVSWIRHFRFS